MAAFVVVMLIAIAFGFAAFIAYLAFFVSLWMLILAAVMFSVAVGMIFTAGQMYADKDEPRKVSHDGFSKYW